MDEPTNPVGRPTKYRPEYVEQVRKLAERGWIEIEIADFLEVARETLRAWRMAHREFDDAFRLGREAADQRVEDSLYHRAVGYSHPAVKFHAVEGTVITTPYTEHYPPDTTAAMKWLVNRRREGVNAWRDKVEHEHTGGVNVTISGDEADL